MSCKERRILNQTVGYINEFFKLQELMNAKEELEHQLYHLEEDIQAIENIQNNILEKLENKECQLSAERMSLFDGTDIAVFIATFDKTVMMYFDGIVVKAKCHPNDEFNLQVGYAICRHRLMQQVMNIKYGIK